MRIHKLQGHNRCFYLPLKMKMVHENSFNRYIFISTHVDNIKTFIIKEADSYMMNQNYCTKIELHIANSYLPCLNCDINLYISSTWFSYN